jgi:hypothetical protein
MPGWGLVEGSGSPRAGAAMGLDDMTLFFTGRDAEAPAGAGRVAAI